jgi:hypothetical protein
VQVQPPVTNKIYVTSLEDALNRYANPNTVLIYILQDETMLFEITTDSQGKKTYKVKELVDSVKQDTAKQDAPNYATKEELQAVESRLTALFKGVTNE